MQHWYRLFSNINQLHLRHNCVWTEHPLSTENSNKTSPLQFTDAGEMTMTSFAITLYSQCCWRHVVGHQVVKDIGIIGSWSICSLCSESNASVLLCLLIDVLDVYCFAYQTYLDLQHGGMYLVIMDIEFCNVIAPYLYRNFLCVYVHRIVSGTTWCTQFVIIVKGTTVCFLTSILFWLVCPLTVLLKRLWMNFHEIFRTGENNWLDSWGDLSPSISSILFLSVCALQ